MSRAAAPERLSIRLSTEDLARLEQRAEAEDRSTSAVARRAIRAALQADAAKTSDLAAQ